MKQPTPADPMFHPVPAVCFACGYPLVGLASPGQCPECGESFSGGQVVLEGIPWYGTGGSPLHRLARIVLFADLLLFVSFFCISGLGLLLFDTALLTLMLGVLLAAIILLAATRTRPGELSLIVITDRGVACIGDRLLQIEKRRAVTLVPTGAACTVRLKHLDEHWKRLVIRRAVKGSIFKDYFEARVRCPDAQAEVVEEAIRACLAGNSVGPPPGTPGKPSEAGGAPPNSPPTRGPLPPAGNS